jgi:hypothetical protein
MRKTNVPNMTRRLAPTRFKPHPPALLLKRKQKHCSGLDRLNESTIDCRSFDVPSRRKYPILFGCNTQSSMTVRAEVKLDTTTTLSCGVCLRISCNNAVKTTILPDKPSFVRHSALPSNVGWQQILRSDVKVCSASVMPNVATARSVSCW